MINQPEHSKIEHKTRERDVKMTHEGKGVWLIGREKESGL
jgi:hypothetical protein